MRLIDRAVQLEARNGARYAIRATYRLGLGDPRAAADVQKAHELGAPRSVLLSIDAQAALRKGDPETAFKLYGDLIREKLDWQQHVGVWLALGIQLKKDREITAKFEEWYRQNPEYSEVYAVKAQWKARDNDLAGAAAEDRAGLKVAPYSRKLRAQLASHLYLAGKYAEALAATEAYLEVAPRDFAGGSIRVRCLAALGRADEAKAALDQLAKDFPTRSKEIEDLRAKLTPAGK